MTPMSKHDTQHPTPKQQKPVPPSIQDLLPWLPPKIAMHHPNPKNCCSSFLVYRFVVRAEATNTVARSVQHGLGKLR